MRSVKSAGAGFGLTFLPMVVLIAISGIFYPITGMPDWLHPVAQAFPVYWLGAGMRDALLPDAAAAAELGGQFHTLTTFGVLGAYAVLGLLVAPRVLRAMARKESGSAVESRKAGGAAGLELTWRPSASSCTSASRCCAPNAASRAATWPTAWACTTRRSATSNVASSAPACTWRCSIAAFFDVPVEVVFSIEQFPRLGERTA